MSGITKQVLELLELQYATFARADGQEPPLEDQIRYVSAKRDLLQRFAQSTLDADEARDAVQAYGEADRAALRLAARSKLQDERTFANEQVHSAFARLASDEDPSRSS